MRHPYLLFVPFFWLAGIRRNEIAVGLTTGLAVACLTLFSSVGRSVAQKPPARQPPAAESGDEKSSEAALAIYADAANFQTQGELELAIEQWKKFLSDFPKDPLASQAAHYLGVCRMQLPEPAYAEAAEAFKQALQDRDYELREESLSNLGWCLYAVGSGPVSGGEAGAEVDAEKLNDAIKTFQALMREFPNSKYMDRAMFYFGESLYAQGKAKEAIRAYDGLLTSRFAENSAVRCDAMYAKGVALESLDDLDGAVAAYREMLDACGNDPLNGPVRNQLAEVLILQKEFAEASTLFEEIIAAGGEGVPRALHRRAFALVQLNRAAEANVLYERLIKEFPESEFAASAILSSAQGFYLAGQFEDAAKRFREVVDAQTSPAAATEAAHWLSVIALRNNQVEEAERVAREQIAKGAVGDYATSLRLDAAEAAAMRPGREAETLAEFEQILNDAPNDPLLPRILYNAAFTAFQLRDSEKALAWTKQFENRFPDDPLAADMQFVTAESQLIAGNVDEAIAGYDRLLQVTKPDNPQLPLWILRSAGTYISDARYDTAIGILEDRMSDFSTPALKAEAYFMVGSSELSAERPKRAIEAFKTGLEIDPQWRRADDMAFRIAVAYRSAGDIEQAKRQWDNVIRQYADSRMADQARYQLALTAINEEKFDDATARLEELQSDQADPVLKPYAFYQQGRVAMRQENWKDAATSLSTIVDDYAQHSLLGDALLARAICQRELENLDAASNDLEAFLALNPVGINLANALLEQSVIDRAKDQPAEAAKRLRRIIAEVPDYPEIEKVQFELGELLRELGQSKEAIEVYLELAERGADSSLAADANYKIGQQFYAGKDWGQAAAAYAKTAETTKDTDLLEKSLYRLGWSHFQQKQFDKAAAAFERQAKSIPQGNLSIDSLMMVGESYFAKKDYAQALNAYQRARTVILKRDGEGRRFKDRAEQQVRELVFLHGGQSAAQLERWEDALTWYEEMRTRHKSSDYKSQVLYETGIAYRMLNNNAKSLEFFTETANAFRDESAARARFMMGQIYFEQKKLPEAITEFKRVMYGFGADKAPDSIKDWQAKSGYEAGRCAELLIQSNQGERRQQAIDIAKKYYEFVVTSHASNPLAQKAKERIAVLRKL